jgi:hypothetical protein
MSLSDTRINSSQKEQYCEDKVIANEDLKQKND